MTNYERIKQMSIEEMAEKIFDCGNGREYCYGHCYYQDDNSCPNDGAQGCIQGVVKWLQSEEEENDKT